MGTRKKQLEGSEVDKGNRGNQDLFSDFEFKQMGGELIRATMYRWTGVDSQRVRQCRRRSKFGGKGLILHATVTNT